MWNTSVFVFFTTLFVTVLARPNKIGDKSDEFLKNVNIYKPEKQMKIVKRQIYENIQNDSGKTIPLQSVIGDLEKNFFKSASHASIFLGESQDYTGTNKTQNENQSTLKRKIKNVEQVDLAPHGEEYLCLEKTKASKSTETSTDNIFNKTGETTPIQVGHISTIQPDYDNLHVPSTFEVNHIKPKSFNIKDVSSDLKEIPNTKTNTQELLPQQISEKLNEQKWDMNEEDSRVYNNEQTEVTHDLDNYATEQPLVLESTTTITKKSAAAFKETEAELKEKVAEIEAEPVILSARV